MSLQYPVQKLIELFGQSVTIYRRSIETDDEGVVISDTYSDTITTKAWVTPTRGMREIWNVFGVGLEGDYSALFSGTVPISVNDRVILPDNIETEVREIINHYHKDSVDIREAILVKISAGE